MQRAAALAINATAIAAADADARSEVDCAVVDRQGGFMHGF